MRKVQILDVGVHAQRFDHAISQILEWVEEGKPRYVCTCPVYTLMITHEIPDAKAALDHADMVAADGMPIVWLQRRRGFDEAERCYGAGIMRTIFEKTAGTGTRHFLWGGNPGIPDILEEKLRQQYGEVNIVGRYSPPFEEVGTPPNQVAIDLINNAQPDIVWVGLGSPKQDIWMHLYRPYLNAPVLIGVGAAFDFISGHKRQAPEWMQEVGLEWAFRLAQEPRRLGTRYLKYNTLFIWRLLTE